MKRNQSFFALIILVLATLACKGLSVTPAAPTEIYRLPGPTPVEIPTDEIITDFPLPENIANLTDTGDNAINFQTKMKLEQVITFYRDQFSQAGYTERSDNTAITETTFNLVFDGHSSGKAIILQGTDLGDGSINVNIRLEDV